LFNVREVGFRDNVREVFRVVSHHEVEWGGVSCGMMSRVMNEFSEWEHGCPASLVIGTEDTKVDFEFLVNSFSLAVALRVECGGKGVLVSEESSEFDLESRSKLGSAVRDNFIVKSES
jgi:hypothetical protein